MNNSGLDQLSQLAQQAGAAITAAMQQASVSVVSFSNTVKAQGIASLNQMGQAAKNMANQLAQAGGIVGVMGDGFKRSFMAAQLSIMGFVTAGFRGTVEGERLGFQLQELSREMAGVFVPAMEKLIAGVRTAVTWFRGLSGEQQDNLMKWGLWVAGVTAAVKVLTMFGLMAPIANLAIKGIGIALSAAFANPIVLGVVAITAAVAALVFALTRASDASEQLVANMKQIQQQGLSEQDVKNSAYTAMTKTDDFKNASKEQKLKMIDEQVTAADERLKKQQENAGIHLGGGGGIGSAKELALSQMMQSQKDLEILQRMRQQVEGGNGEINVDKLAGGGKDNEHRRPTPTTGGFEALTETSKRIQESIMKTWDPAAAHAEDVAIAKEQIAAVNNVAVAVKGVNVGVGN